MALDPNSAALSDALVVLGAAGLIIPAFSRMRISPIIGFVFVGMIVGPFGLGRFVSAYPWMQSVTIADPSNMTPFGELGIILLLFSVGLELSFKRLWMMRRKVGGIGAAELIGNAALIAIILLVFDYELTAALGLGLALALSSTALVLPISGTKSAVGSLAFAMLLFEDLSLIPIIFLLGALGSGSRDMSELAGIIGFGIVVVGALFVGGRLILPPIFAQAARTKSPELFLSVTLLVVLIASLATLSAGLSAIMGALVAGLLIAETEYKSEVEAVISPFKNLALGVFLLTVGMQLDLNLVAHQWVRILLATAMVITIKTLFTIGLLRLGKVRAAVAAETGILMASPSELTLIVLATAMSANLIDASTAAFWSSVTAIGLVITPLLAKLGHALATHLDGQALTPFEPQSETTIIIGFGRVGEMIASMLDVHQRTWMAVEANVDLVSEARRRNLPVRYGDIGHGSALDNLPLDTAHAVVLTMDDPVQAVRLTKRIRTAHPNLTVVARARDADHAAELYRAGVSDAVPETLEASLQLAECVLVDLGIAMGPVIASIHDKRDELRTAIKDAGELHDAPKLRTG